MNTKQIIEALQAPFKESEYEWRVQSENYSGAKVRVLCYVQARAIQNRLDDVMGPFGWQVSYSQGPGGGIICKLSLLNSETAEWVGKEDGAENTDIEPVKGGLSGAIKRAGSAWGIGRLLYNLEATEVPLQGQGLHYHKVKKGDNKDKWMYWTPPVLPDWAVAKPKAASGAKPPPAAKQPATMAHIKGEAGQKFLKNYKVAPDAIKAMRETVTIPADVHAYVTKWYEVD